MGEMLDNRIEAIKKNPLLLDPIQYSFYQVNTFKNSEYNAFVDKKKEVGFWNALSYQLGKATTNVAAIGVSGEIGNGIGGMFPSGGISMEFTMPQFATANGAMMTAVQVSVSKSNILLAANMMGGGLAAQGVMYSTSQSNKNFSNNTSNNSSNTSQGSSSGGIEGKINNKRFKTNNLPKNPDELMKNGWEDVTPDGMAKNTTSREFINSKTGDKVRFDAGKEGANGFEAKNHYHIYNPNSTGKGDYYLDVKGNPVSKNSKSSHILP